MKSSHWQIPEDISAMIAELTILASQETMKRGRIRSKIEVLREIVTKAYKDLKKK